MEAYSVKSPRYLHEALFEEACRGGDSLEDRARSYRRVAPKMAIDTRGKGGADFQFLSISVPREHFCYMFANSSHLLPMEE